MRKLRGLTQQQLAIRLNLSPPTIYRMEKNVEGVTVESVARAARELGMGFDWKTRRVIPPDDFPAAAFELPDDG